MSIFSSLFGFKVTDSLSSLLHNLSTSANYLSGNLTESAQYLTGNITSVTGNITSSISSVGFYCQLGLAGVGLSQCICSSIDACTTLSPLAKPLYIVSALSSGLGSASSLGCCAAALTCPPIVPVFIVSGIGFRFGAKYATKSALLLNPLPCLSEII
jgi:hypothetical protein